ncbi:hypothetical protein ACLOJK_018132 [Asimina triloba]
MAVAWSSFSEAASALAGGRVPLLRAHVRIVVLVWSSRCVGRRRASVDSRHPTREAAAKRISRQAPAAAELDAWLMAGPMPRLMMIAPHSDELRHQFMLPHCHPTSPSAKKVSLERQHFKHRRPKLATSPVHTSHPRFQV